MAVTYVALDSQTVTSAVSSVTFSGISQAYTDLVVVVNAATSNNTPLYMKPNSNSSSVYSTTWLLGNGSAASSSRYNQTALGGAGILIDNYGGVTGFPSTFAGMAKYEIMNYSNTTTFKTILIRAGSAAGWTVASANLFASTAAISSLYLYPYTGTFAVGSTFTLYGIASAAVVSGAKATGGDTVATDGTYWYHAFRTSGTFTPLSALTCDVLVVAGGGGGGHAGGNRGGGGGGAGGVLGFASQTVSSATTVTVGAGGASKTQGSNSQFASLTASVGGGKGESPNNPGGNGGSGGGASVGSGGTATSGQGFAGGSGHSPGGSGDAGGGGGGAGAVGANGAPSTPGAGGAGVNTYTNATWLSTGLSVTGTGVSGYIAGGGGGSGTNPASAGAGGAGGGGAGSGTTTGTAGTANTGGGGGSSLNTTGATGGSGLVIVRYAV